MTNRPRIAVMFVLVVASILCIGGRTRATQPKADEAVAEVAVEVTNVGTFTDDLTPASTCFDGSEQLNYTPAVPLDASATDGLLASLTAAKCKHCKDRPWCSCTYNGLPRVSCNPCCYGNLGIPQVCLD
jgi:hypothetical protein